MDFSQKPTNEKLSIFSLFNSFPFLRMENNLSNSITISPRKLRNDLYSSNNNKIPLVIYVLESLIERTLARNARIAKKYKSVLYMTEMVSSRKDDHVVQIFDSHEALVMTTN